ncbi:MAG: peptidylprolyl isomerase [Myxococcota bacterium]|nr:peptidylprolyl isomerase [Myxococcota bacterium]
MINGIKINQLILATLFLALGGCEVKPTTSIDSAKSTAAKPKAKPAKAKTATPHGGPKKIAKEVVQSGQRPAAKKTATPRVQAQKPLGKSKTGGTRLAQQNGAQAPAQYRVRLDTTRGAVHIDVNRSWAPRGADRFYALVKSGYYTDVAFFRVISGFMAQTGLSGDPRLSAQWSRASIKDDPVSRSNQRGMVTFATRGKNTRSMQFFINYKNNAFLDKQGFSPFGQIDAAGMAIIDQLYSGYGEGAPRGKGPSQADIRRRGNPYLKADFPKLDYIRRASIVSPNLSKRPNANLKKTTSSVQVAGPKKSATNQTAKTSANLKAPAKYKVLFTTTKGRFLVHVTTDWAPIGAQRFYQLVTQGFYSNTAFFRVIPGFMAQVGIHGDPKINAGWRNATIKDDPVTQSNKRGYVTFAKTGRPHSRTTQFFINFGNNSRLDGMAFAPFGFIDDKGMEVVDALYSGYGEGAPRGKGPAQGMFASRGNAYLKQYFPKLDYIVKAEIYKP